MTLDLLIQNIHVFNVHLKRFVPGHLGVLGSRIYCVYPATGSEPPAAAEILDGGGAWAIPGLIDIHLHVESSMLTPRFFSEALIRNGVTTAVADPHEITNVFGVEGIQAMIRASQAGEVDLFYQIPSCVPATDLETAGAEIGEDELTQLAEIPEIIALGEVMDYVDVIRNPASRIRPLVEAARRQNLILEGHCPNLTGLELAAYMYFGSDSDHTLQSVPTLEARVAQGMFIEIQEKSISPETMTYLNTLQNFDYFALVTDDVMADDLARAGHLNVVVRQAIQEGLAPAKAIYAATFAPAQRMRLHDRGALTPGKIADLLLLKDLQSFDIAHVIKKGRVVEFEASEQCRCRQFPEKFYRSVRLASLAADQFSIAAPVQRGTVTCRVIEVQPHTTYTNEEHRSIPVSNGQLQWQGAGVGCVAVFERHGRSSNASCGLITGSCLRRGAVATTYAHDSHNLLVVGFSAEEMSLAANTVLNSQGGIAVVEGESVKAHLPLPVAGLMAEAPVADVGEQLARVKQALTDLGYQHRNVLMSLSTLTLPVSPALKISDRGLIHVPSREFVSLFV